MRGGEPADRASKRHREEPEAVGGEERPGLEVGSDRPEVAGVIVGRRLQLPGRRLGLARHEGIVPVKQIDTHPHGRFTM
jgi:hypothetical protein